MQWRTCRIVNCGQPCCTVIFHISHKRHDFRRKGCGTQNVCLDVLCKFAWNISHSKKNWARYDQIYMGLHVKCLLFLSNFNKTRIFFTDFSKKTQISNFTKIRPVGSELFHAEGRTDMTKLFVTFCNFAKGPEKRTYEKEIMPPPTTFSATKLALTSSGRQPTGNYSFVE